MPHRQPLLQLLKNYQPLNDEEKHWKSLIRSFVEANTDCFLRSNLSGHITASCWLLSPKHDEVLLTHHKKIGLWLQLGGHTDGDSDVLVAALREAQEESGIEGIIPLSGAIFDVEVHKIDEHQGVPEHYHYDVRFALEAPHKDFLVSDESHGLMWISIADLAFLDGFNESLKRMAKKWLGTEHAKEKRASQAKPAY